MGLEYAAKWLDVYARIREILETDEEAAGISCAQSADKKE